MRLAELIGTFSLAADAGTGVPQERGLRAATIAVRVGELAGAPASTLADAYYVALLRFTGCTAGSHIAAEVMNDELEFAARMPLLDYGRAQEMLPALLMHALRGKGVSGGLRALRAMLAALPNMPEVGREHCETATILARRMGFGDAIGAALTQGFERWDGSGRPAALRADAIQTAVRLAQIGHDFERGFHAGGLETAVALVKKHAGRELDPRLVDVVAKRGSDLAPLLEARSAWAAGLEAEPAPERLVDDDGLEHILLAMADFSDMKSRYTRGHSRAVAARARAAARHLRLGAALEQRVYRAGLVHDIGRVAVSSRIWDKAAPLTDAEWERVRLHSYVGERILSRAASLAPIAELASLSHERLDGTGYHRRLPASSCPLPARILAAADVFQALCEQRPHRPARAFAEAATELRKAVETGALAREAVDAVLVSVTEDAPRTEAPLGLTGRELEVLALVARGLTNKEVGSELSISAKTAGHHLEKIYAKLGVTTRSGATMQALQRGLLKA